ncbi:hypothetical protein K474DRAFT_1700979 [Panus rudis PR-1116 ss-1]|nr:hypothetical protein K474DRAFT_1700979 [Panus rudis PR-1116 ss-1]
MGRPDFHRRNPRVPPMPITTTTRPRIPDYVTFRLGESMIYVTPVESFSEAADYALSVFPDDLRGVSKEQISFTTVTNLNGGEVKKEIGIDAKAWRVLMTRLHDGHIINVHVRPKIIINDVPYDEDPPNYDNHPQYVSQQEERASSSQDTQGKPSGSGSNSRSTSRSSSRSSSRSPSPSPSVRERAKDWLVRRLTD